MSNPAIVSDRARQLLRVLVERYISEGQPVSSRALARDTGFELSPATIRNVMADLEDMGLITSPHTSAGRIPTTQGYRFFVDSLLTIQPLTSSEVQRLQSELDPDKNIEELMETASNVLSEVSKLASLVLLPRGFQPVLRQVEFLPLSENRVLVILITNEREVQNRIIHTARQYNPSELQQAANYLNSLCAGQDLYKVREILLKELQETRERMNDRMRLAIEMADKAFTMPEPAPDYVVKGQAHLLSRAETDNLEKLRQLFEAFNEKRDILHLLDQCLHAKGVQIFIGEESGYNALEDYSLITAPYEAHGQVAGVLGVVGPTRMGYERMIPLVDITAKLLSAALTQR